MDRKYFTYLLALNVFTASHCMITHIALSMALSYIASNSILVFSLFTGLYLMSMGLGVLFIEKFRLGSERLIVLIIINSLLGILMANPGITGTIVLNEFSRYLMRIGWPDTTWAIYGLGAALTILIGMISGAELPIFSKLIEEERWHASKPIIKVLTSDYLGAFLGIAIFSFILNPFAGLLDAILISQLVTLIIVNMAFYAIPSTRKNFWLELSLWILDAYVLLMFIFKGQFAMFVDAISGF